MGTFTANLTAPNGTPVVTGVINFPDGQRSVAAVYRNNWPLPANWEQNGWKPRKPTNSANGQYQPMNETTFSAAALDGALAAGDILFYLGGNLGSAGGHAGYAGLPWPMGWWTHKLSGVHAADVAAFQWAVQQLNNGTTAAVTGNAPPQVVPMPMPSAQSQDPNMQVNPGPYPAQQQAPMPLPPAGLFAFFTGLPPIAKILLPAAVLGLIAYSAES